MMTGEAGETELNEIDKQVTTFHKYSNKTDPTIFVVLFLWLLYILPTSNKACTLITKTFYKAYNFTRIVLFLQEK